MARVGGESELSGKAMKAVWLVIGLVASAGLAAVSLETKSHAWLGWIMLIPLLLAIRILTPHRALVAGLVWGTCLCAFSALTEGVLFEPTANDLFRLVTVLAAYAWLGARITRRTGFSPLMLALGWVVVEVLLQPLGLRNGLLAGTQNHALVVHTLGQLAGYMVVAFVIVYVNASILTMLTAVAIVPGGSRRAPRSNGVIPKLLLFEEAAIVFRFLQPKQARAPPPGKTERRAIIVQYGPPSDSSTYVRGSINALVDSLCTLLVLTVAALYGGDAQSRDVF